MKTAIVFASNSGTTRKCAERLAAIIPDSELFDISRGRRFPSVGDFGSVIVGTPVRMGQLHDNAVRFMDTNKQQLLAMPHALFVCSGFPENIHDYFENLFPLSLVQTAFWHGSLGGELELSRMGMFDRMMMKSVQKQNGCLPEMEIDYDSLGALADAACSQR